MGSVFLLSCLGAGRGVEDTPPRARSLLFWLLLGAAEEEEKNAERLKPDVGVLGTRRFADHSLQLSLSFGFPKTLPDDSQLRWEERVHRTGHVSDSRCVGVRGWQKPSLPEPSALRVAIHSFLMAAITICHQLGGLE